MVNEHNIFDQVLHETITYAVTKHLNFLNTVGVPISMMLSPKHSKYLRKL